MDILEVLAILFAVFVVPTGITMLLFSNRADVDERMSGRG